MENNVFCIFIIYFPWLPLFMPFHSYSIKEGHMVEWLLEALGYKPEVAVSIPD
jgi:hypothetical protein